MKMNFLIAIVSGLFLTGCGYELPKTAEPADNVNTVQANKTQNAGEKNAGVNQPAATSSNNAAAKENSGPLVFSEGSQTATYPCGGREVEFAESSTAYTITLTGECEKLVVDGVSNRVNVEKVGEIVVKGVSNKVVYGEGLNGKKPKISKSGPSTEVNSREEMEKKKAR